MDDLSIAHCAPRQPEDQHKNINPNLAYSLGMEEVNTDRIVAYDGGFWC
jgi:hypothetical protein